MYPLSKPNVPMRNYIIVIIIGIIVTFAILNMKNLADQNEDTVLKEQTLIHPNENTLRVATKKEMTKEIVEAVAPAVKHSPETVYTKEDRIKRQKELIEWQRAGDRAYVSAYYWEFFSQVRLPPETIKVLIPLLVSKQSDIRDVFLSINTVERNTGQRLSPKAKLQALKDGVKSIDEQIKGVLGKDFENMETYNAMQPVYATIKLVTAEMVGARVNMSREQGSILIQNMFPTPTQRLIGGLIPSYSQVIISNDLIIQLAAKGASPEMLAALNSARIAQLREGISKGRP